MLLLWYSSCQALHRLHQLEVFGRRLIVEFAHSIRYSTQQSDKCVCVCVCVRHVARTFYVCCCSAKEDHPPVLKSSAEQDQPIEATGITQGYTDNNSK